VLAAQRQSRILEEVNLAGGVRVSDLARLLGVSDMTVRRDLEALAARGLLDKVHGGATARSGGSTDEPGFRAKFARERAAKEAIAERAAELVVPGTAIAVSAGTTTAALARHLTDVADLTVVTNSIPVADELHENGRRDLTLVLTGGMRTPSDALVGPVAVQALSGLHVDLLFLGVHGMSEPAGLTTPNLMESETNRAMIDAARMLVVVADATKWDIVGLSRMARLDEATVLVTDERLPPEARRVLEERVGEIICVGVPDSELDDS
jgi:DeoR/GlpR family transcriptional regulator of sugar metabolism